MSSRKFLIPSFAGDPAANEKYRNEFRPQLLSELERHCQPTHEFGLVGLAVGATEWATYSATPFVALTRVAQPPGNASNMAWNIYQEDRNNFEKQENAISLAIGTIFENLGPTALALLIDPATTRYTKSLSVILANLDAQYQQITRQELQAARATLQTRFNPASDFKTHVTTHRQTHATYVAAAQPLSQNDKINFLVESMEHDNEARAAIRHYFNTYPSLANQTFEDLVTAIGANLANRSGPTTSDFVNMAASSRTTADLTQQVEALTRQVNQLQRALAEGRPTASTKKYCWTHGPNGSHESKDCRYPNRGKHQNEATMENRMGGADRFEKYGKK
jgi:hypothetical protein